MHYVKQIFGGVPEDWVHERFVRYGRGEFEGPIVSVAKSGKGVKVSASWEYASALVEVLASAGGTLEVKGSVFARRDISGALKDFLAVSKEKKKKGLYSADVVGELDADAFKGLLGMIPDAILLLDASAGRSKVKCKKKPPKPGSGLDESFCTGDYEGELLGKVRNEILFDVSGDFTEARASHKYLIKELVAPAGVSDPAKIRVEAKRKGTIERNTTVDGKEYKKTAVLLV
jgi:hypothetical protein